MVKAACVSGLKLVEERTCRSHRQAPALRACDGVRGATAAAPSPGAAAPPTGRAWPAAGGLRTSVVEDLLAVPVHMEHLRNEGSVIRSRRGAQNDRSDGMYFWF